MGYALVRFVGEIDPEFLCHICKSVLENPVQIPCDHSYCYDCIKHRITTHRTCPVDLIPIKICAEIPVFKSPCVAFRNLLYKLNIMCDFQSVGCSKIINLESLSDHVKSCKHNPDAEIVCDNGCNLTVTRREYKTNNCSSHLQQEIVKLTHRVSFQRKRFEGLANCLYLRINKLNDELNCNRSQKQQLENVIRIQHQEITALKSKIVTNTPPKWQICHNMHIDEWNNLKIDDHDSSTFAFVQSYYPLQPTRHCFQIQLSKSPENSSVQRGIWIGLTRKGHAIVRNPEVGSIAFIWNGRIRLNGECVAIGPKWNDGEVIKLGFKFPNSFMIEGNNSAVVCLHRNEELYFEKRVKMPEDGFFPTICIYGRDTKVALTFK